MTSSEDDGDGGMPPIGILMPLTGLRSQVTLINADNGVFAASLVLASNELPAQSAVLKELASSPQQVSSVSAHKLVFVAALQAYTASKGKVMDPASLDLNA